MTCGSDTEDGNTQAEVHRVTRPSGACGDDHKGGRGREAAGQMTGTENEHMKSVFVDPMKSQSDTRFIHSQSAMLLCRGYLNSLDLTYSSFSEGQRERA